MPKCKFLDGRLSSIPCSEKYKEMRRALQIWVIAFVINLLILVIDRTYAWASLIYFVLLITSFVLGRLWRFLRSWESIS